MKRARLFAILVFGFAFFGLNTALADSPIKGMAEFRFGSYYPSKIDEEPGLSGEPFADTFGTSSSLMMELDVNFYVLRHDVFGKLGVGGSIGQVSFSGNADVSDPSQTSTSQLRRQRQNNGNSGSNGSGNGGSDGGDNDSGSGSGGSGSISEEVTFNVYPLRGSVIYLYDYHVRHWNIPVAPVFRAGLDYYIWNAKDGGGDVSSAGGNEAVGGKAGWHYGAGVYFLLDFIDEGSAASMDSTWGINNSYLFAQYLKTEADGFGEQGFDLSDERVTFGLAFEF